MITTKNNFSGAAFDYTAESCTASGEFRRLDGALQTVNISGRYTSDTGDYSFWANRDEMGNVNISGVPYTVISAVALQVAALIGEIEALDEDSETEEDTDDNAKEE